MIVCSCKVVSTEDIRAAAQFMTEPNPKQVLNMLNWNSECATCTKNLVEEINKVIGEMTGEA